ncbi:MAG TPA: homoserine kinase [Candidatus Binatia bacterium]|nr:homoserine kinase [Candidatus Binatia bacterium]
MSVFTKVSHSELREFLRQYSVGELLGYTGIGEGVENTNYFVDTLDGRWVLTLFERLDHKDLPFFLGLMEHLAARGLPLAMPLHTHAGTNLTTLNGKPAALVHRLTGQSVLFPSLEQCRQVGCVLGEMHVAGRSYAVPCRNSRGADWRVGTAQALLGHVPQDAHALIEDELSAQRALDLSLLPQGVIHADLFKDNVLFVDQRLTGVIDFYYACNDALLYDLAVTVNDWCFEPDGAPNPARWQALISAYRSRRVLEPAESAAWGLALRAAAFRFYLSRLYDWTFPRAGDVVHIKDPEPYRRILAHHRAELPPAL